MNKCKVAIIGAGYMAEEHIKAFQALNNVNVLGIYSRSLPKAQNLAVKYNIPNICNSISELYDKTQADLVVIAVTETAIQSLLSTLIKYDWNLLFEKPVGLNFNETMIINEQIEDVGRRAIVAHNRRFYSATSQVVADLENSLGKRTIFVQDYQSLSIARSFNYSNEIIQGWMYANSIHLIDYFYTFGRGTIEEVKIVRNWCSDKLDPVIAHITFDSGDEGLYQGIWHGPGPWGISVTTETDHFEMRPLEQATRRTLKERTPKIYEQSKEDLNFKPGLVVQAMEAINFVQKKPNNSITLRQSLKTMELISKIYA